MTRVLFVCVKNGGKSQMAAGLFRQAVADGPDLGRWQVESAGTQAGSTLNALSVETVAEVGVDITDQQPCQLTHELQQAVDVVVTVGEADVDPLPGPTYETWEIDEPSLRGVDGAERMRLVRDDINRHVQDLHHRLTTPAETEGFVVTEVAGQVRPTDYAVIVDDLAYSFDGVFSRATIAQAVTDARARLEPTAKITTFLPVLVSRFAREQLTAAGQADGTVAHPVPELLFVCVHNAGRSQLAAALASHLSGGRVHVRSAGSDLLDEVDPLVIQVLTERGITLSDAYPKPLTGDVVRAADVIVTMGCGDTCPVFPGKRYLDWDIPDPVGQPVGVVRDIRDQMQARVTALLRDLNI